MVAFETGRCRVETKRSPITCWCVPAGRAAPRRPVRRSSRRLRFTTPHPPAMPNSSRASGRLATQRAVATLLLTLGTTACARHAVPVPGHPVNTRPPTVTTPVADEMFRRTNARRRTEGMAALARSELLTRAAQLQAEQMASTGRMDHELRGTRYPTLMTRLEAVSYEVRAAGENIAEGYRDASSVVDGWMSSPGHRANILSSSYSEVGTAVAVSLAGRAYYAQVFGLPLRPMSATASR